MMDHTDAVEVALSEHRRIEELVGELESTRDRAQIEVLFPRIVGALLAHEAAERQVVYPAFGSRLPQGAEGNGLVVEHDEIDQLLEELCSLAPDGYAFAKRVSALLLEIQGHFLREEELVYTPLRAMLTADELEELGRRIIEIQSQMAA
jgi:hemerythrin superfamily protein